MLKQPLANKFWTLFKKILPFLILFLVSLIPVYYTWGKLAIGGDTILPFNPEGVQKFLWQWYGSENGQYFAQNLVPLYLIYKVAGYFSLSLTAVSAIIFFSFNFLAGTAIYKLCNLIYKPKETLYLAFPVIFYVISPAVLNGWHYSFIYAFAPWFVYFVVKILVTRRILIIDLLLVNVVIFFASVDLPNPKYLVYLYLFAFITMLAALLLKIISFRSILRNWWKIILFFLFSSYLLLPLTFFALNYSPENYSVHIKQNYSDTGLFMDQGSSTIDKMIQLHHSGLNINSSERIKYNQSKKTVFAGSVFFIGILLSLFLKKKNQRFKIELILLAMVCLFLFFAVGPNPPLGFLYIGLVSNIGLLAFLRTTAGAVFFLSILYSILLFGFLEDLNTKYRLAVLTILSLALLMSSYPLLNGNFYENLDVVGNPTIDKKSYGVNIPNEYFEVKKVIDQKKIDGKLLNLKNNLSYINTNWGYFGPSVYNYLFNYYNIAYNNIISKSENHSVAFTLDDKSLIIDKSKSILKIDNTTTQIDNNILTLNSVVAEDYLAHFWIPTKSYNEDKLLGDLAETSNKKAFGEAVYLTGQNKSYSQTLEQLPTQTIDKPNIEYRKINPTKYRLIIHQAKNPFPLIFNETFNKNWKIYLVNNRPQAKSELLAELENYQIIANNEDFQATKEEVKSDIDLGLVTSLKSGMNNAGVKPTFVSKKLFGTIQNDNLQNGSPLDTLFSKTILDQSHLVANGYANSWLVDPSAICKQSANCQANSDGTYDITMFIEFLPQRIFWLGLIISLTSISISIVFLVFRLLKRKIKQI